MTEKVQIDIVATDDASKAIGDVNQELKSMSDVVRSGALKDLKDDSVAVFKAIGGVTIEYVDIAADAEQVQTRLNIQLKNLGKTAPVTADQINDLSTELMKISGFDDDALVD